MLKYFCSKICEQLEKAEIITMQDKPLYLYGLYQGGIQLLNIIITFLSGFILDMPWHAVLFLLSYIPIRTYAGGFHAKTPTRCYISSIILVIAILLVMKEFLFSSFICIVGIIVSSIGIFLLAPVEDENKPFSEKEQIQFKKTTRTLLFAELFFVVIAFIFDFKIIYTCIFMSFVTLGVMLILGKIKLLYGKGLCC